MDRVLRESLARCSRIKNSFPHITTLSDELKLFLSRYFIGDLIHLIESYLRKNFSRAPRSVIFSAPSYIHVFDHNSISYPHYIDAKEIIKNTKLIAMQEEEAKLINSSADKHQAATTLELLLSRFCSGSGVFRSKSKVKFHGGNFLQEDDYIHYVSDKYKIEGYWRDKEISAELYINSFSYNYWCGKVYRTEFPKEFLYEANSLDGKEYNNAYETKFLTSQVYKMSLPRKTYVKDCGAKFVDECECNNYDAIAIVTRPPNKFYLADHDNKHGCIYSERLIYKFPFPENLKIIYKLKHEQLGLWLLTNPFSNLTWHLLGFVEISPLSGINSESSECSESKKINVGRGDGRSNIGRGDECKKINIGRGDGRSNINSGNEKISVRYGDEKSNVGRGNGRIDVGGDGRINVGGDEKSDVGGDGKGNVKDDISYSDRKNKSYIDIQIINHGCVMEFASHILNLFLLPNVNKMPQVNPLSLKVPAILGEQVEKLSKHLDPLFKILIDNNANLYRFGFWQPMD